MLCKRMNVMHNKARELLETIREQRQRNERMLAVLGDLLSTAKEADLAARNAPNPWTAVRRRHETGRAVLETIETNGGLAGWASRLLRPGREAVRPSTASRPQPATAHRRRRRRPTLWPTTTASATARTACLQDLRMPATSGPRCKSFGGLCGGVEYGRLMVAVIVLLEVELFLFVSLDPGHQVLEVGNVRGMALTRFVEISTLSPQTASSCRGRW